MSDKPELNRKTRSQPRSFLQINARSPIELQAKPFVTTSYNSSNATDNEFYDITFVGRATVQGNNDGPRRPEQNDSPPAPPSGTSNFRIFRALVQQHIDAQYSSNGNSSTLRSPGKVNKPAPLPPPAKISGQEIDFYGPSNGFSTIFRSPRRDNESAPSTDAKISGQQIDSHDQFNGYSTILRGPRRANESAPSTADAFERQQMDSHDLSNGFSTILRSPGNVNKSPPPIPTRLMKANPEYFTKGPKRGIVLIINNIQLLKEPDERSGADCDGDNLSSMFRDFGFDIYMHRNLKQEAIIEKVRKFRSNRSLSRCDMCIVVIMSYGHNQNVSGERREIMGIDEKTVSTEDVINEFSIEKCPAMKGKPKIFIFQCCGGSSSGLGITRKLADVNNVEPNVFVAYSTFPSVYSYYPLYIQCICEVFLEHAKDQHIEELFKIVDQELSKRSPAIQMTLVYENRNFKRCYLNPK